MVYDKARSGDPDYDDKVPQEQHAGGVVVSAGDGVILSPVLGPVDANGAHVNLGVDTADVDFRPTPGNVAEKASMVQDYEPEDTPTFMEPTEADRKDIDQVAAGQAAASTFSGQDTIADTSTVSAPAAPAPANRTTAAKDKSSK